MVRRFRLPGSAGTRRVKFHDPRAMTGEVPWTPGRATAAAFRISGRCVHLRNRWREDQRAACVARRRSPGHRYSSDVDVPVQFFQSTIAIELAVAGALPWQIRYFERDGAAARDGEQLPDPRLQLLFALVIGATVFGSLWAIADQGEALAATFVTIGVAISFLPILIRVLPPLVRDAHTSERRPDHAVTVGGLVLYAVVIAGVITLINID
jgi:hypothetical protein